MQYGGMHDTRMFFWKSRPIWSQNLVIYWTVCKCISSKTAAWKSSWVIWRQYVYVHINNQEISILLFLLEIRSFLTSIICSLRRILVDLVLYPRRQRPDLVKIFVAGSVSWLLLDMSSPNLPWLCIWTYLWTYNTLMLNLGHEFIMVLLVILYLIILMH